MYTKLFSRITESSLMEEPLEVRYTFVMLLAICDQTGHVIGTNVAIARRINMPLADFERCLKALMAPDEHSNSREEDGRRVVLSDGERGLKVVNYVTYRDMKSDEEKRNYMREYMRKRREAQRIKDGVKQRKPLLTDVTHAEAEAEAEAVPPNPPKGTLPALELQLSDAVPPKRSKKTVAYTDDFEAFWRIYPRGEGKAEAFEQWRKITDLPPVNELLAIIEQHKKTQAWIEQNGKFIPHCQRWLSKRRWEDKIDLHLGTNGHQPKHPAYTKERATAGLTAEQIGTF